MKKKKVIIGIHGLGNKPPALLLEEWWRLAIQEGLARVNCKREVLNFRLVYWADILHPKPLDIHETDEDEEDYLDERYVPAGENISEENTSFKTSIINSVKDQLNGILFNEKLHVSFPQVTDFVIKHFFQDLSAYYTKKCKEDNEKYCLASVVIRERLAEVLRKNKKNDILLVAHSMGTIVAYDVLIALEDEVNINSLITIGSPLGVPFIYEKLKADNNQSGSEKARTPHNIQNAWYNFADLRDKLAVNYKFEELFSPNKNGVHPKFAIVNNDYEVDGAKNPHKSFGYLRTVEVATIIEKFILPAHVKFNRWLGDKFSSIMDKLRKKGGR